MPLLGGAAGRGAPPAALRFERGQTKFGAMSVVASGLLTGVSFTWLGLVLGVSFLEAPLKFRAPGVTARLGLGIGRLVFRALNRVELVLLLLVFVAVGLGPTPTTRAALATPVAVILAVQLLAVRPALNRRADRVLAGEELPRSRAHHVYLVLELAKVAALIALGAVAVSS